MRRLDTVRLERKEILAQAFAMNLLLDYHDRDNVNKTAFKFCLLTDCEPSVIIYHNIINASIIWDFIFIIISFDI